MGKTAFAFRGVNRWGKLRVGFIFDDVERTFLVGTQADSVSASSMENTLQMEYSRIVFGEIGSDIVSSSQDLMQLRTGCENLDGTLGLVIRCSWFQSHCLRLQGQVLVTRLHGCVAAMHTSKFAFFGSSFGAGLRLQSYANMMLDLGSVHILSARADRSSSLGLASDASCRTSPFDPFLYGHALSRCWFRLSVSTRLFRRLTSKGVSAAELFYLHHLRSCATAPHGACSTRSSGSCRPILDFVGDIAFRLGASVVSFVVHVCFLIWKASTWLFGAICSLGRFLDAIGLLSLAAQLGRVCCP